ncbi:HAT family dimerisation domain containing protein [Striga asiatica]|uniref:HAT family dimerisation domain containing protein n=1 Tax=Striga asiatica TaxID=4170 RepID=A0A5A7NX81_STRAF|nr:HAT family dimerisation domain containing protein [Striga asiatica]
MADDSPTGGPPSTNASSAASQTSKLKRSRPESSSAAADATVGTGIAGDGKNTRRSIVWHHFTQIVVEGISRAEYNHCHKTYKCNTRRNGTSVLLHHMSVCKAHPNVTEKKQSKLNLQSIAEGDEMVGSLTSWKFDQEAIKSKLARMVIIDELPFLFVEGDGFKNFMSASYIHMRCIAHIINLVMVGGINEIKYSLKKIRHAVRFVKQSSARLAKFRECCNDEGIVSKILLCLDVSTRWNSTYLMLNVAQV